jgi:hypothetical protein
MTSHLPLYIPVWDTHCHIILWPKDMRAALKRAKVSDTDIAEVIEESCRGITFTNVKDEAVIVIKEKMGRAELIGTIAHEAFHATDILLSERDVFLRRGDHNEAHAYLLGWIVEQAAKKL